MPGGYSWTKASGTRPRTFFPLSRDSPLPSGTRIWTRLVRETRVSGVKSIPFWPSTWTESPFWKPRSFGSSIRHPLQKVVLSDTTGSSGNLDMAAWGPSISPPEPIKNLRDRCYQLLRPIHAIPEIEWRFQQEIQILANLNHPNIAKLYEVGRTEEGVPYFIMEPVDGLPITRFCAENNFSVEKRLKLFQKVCGAVEYAHQNLVVHRDLKPSNILVTPAGEPKLLDFGIAKLLQATDSPDPATVTRLRFFTQDYASPEQVSGQQIATASDIYSLGVLLYELLTGSLPYSLKGHTDEEVRRIICEQEPEIPSRTSIPKSRPYSGKMASSSGEAHRDRESRKLRRQLQGDLDKIVMMALRKEPSRRYRSVEQLAGDIDAHLQGFPVSARGDSWKYRATKFLRRNRLAATLTVAVVILSLGFGILMTLQQRQTARERDRATWISGFLTETFESADPGEESWNTVTARDLLDQAAARLHFEDSTDPLVAAGLAATIGNAYRNLGLREQAQPLLERALSLRRKAVGESHPLVAESLTDLASLFQEWGDFARAKQHFSEATRILKGQRHPDDALQAHLLNELGRFYYATDQFQLAETSYAKAIVFSERAYGKNAPDTVTMRLNLAVLAYRRGQYHQAERLYKEICEAHKKIYGPEHPKVAVPLANLAVLYRTMSRFQEAEPLYLHALKIQEKALGPNHPRVANTLSNMGTFYRKLKRYPEAEAAFKRAIQIKEQKLSPNHPSLATTLNSLALLYKAQKRHKEAELLYRRALAIQEKALGPDAQLSPIS